MKAYLIAYNNPDSEGLKIIGIHQSIDSAEQGIIDFVKEDTDDDSQIREMKPEDLYYFKRGVTIKGFRDGIETECGETEYYINEYELIP